MSEVESTLQRISGHKGVLGCIVLNADGIVLKTTCDSDLTDLHASLIPQLAAMARNMVRELDPQNDLEFLRVRSHKQEIMVAPSGDCVLIVIQEAKGA
ncbi:hypothetical protein WJX84_000493 [Apatococcus fuscideae]|uniref:Dynein light chain roadblock n=1 Tax=Apatococcus fuscideae TaxID=2026836 RepID=A0AAW1TIZ7_9CHLO